ncbi:MAG: Cys-Gln thioester bond-forming surface protein, partial [Bacilli bacterium]|nr:Cys-Gln thioester bond-forming surface protein [Bacilli bacterium]
MKKIKSVIKTLLLLFIAAFSFSYINVYAAAPKTIQTASSFDRVPGYIDGVEFNIKKTTAGKYLYCMDIHKSAPKNMTLTLAGVQDAGMTYIMVNGYPNKSITGNSKYDYYITQTAVWWYLDLTTGSSNLSSAFKNGASDPHGLRSHIKKLAYGAQSAKKTGYVKPKLTLSNNTVTFSLSSDGKYYVSNDITVSASYIKDYVNLALANSPSGSTIIDAKGNTVTKVKNGAKVRVKVPVSSVKNLQNSFYIKATATGKVQKSYLYKPSSGAYQSVTMSVLYAEESALKAQKSLSLKGTEVKITKVDSESGKALAGAKLQLKNASGTVVASWTTTTSAYVIKNLAAGKYTIVETAAPSGYKLSDVKQEVTVVAGSSVSAKFYNSKKEPTKVTIIKRDKATNQTLAGAKFVLKNAKGEVVTSWTSTTNGHYVKGLAEGTYTIEEVEA